ARRRHRVRGRIRHAQAALRDLGDGELLQAFAREHRSLPGGDARRLLHPEGRHDAVRRPVAGILRPASRRGARRRPRACPRHRAGELRLAGGARARPARAGDAGARGGRDTRAPRLCRLARAARDVPDRGEPDRAGALGAAARPRRAGAGGLQGRRPRLPAREARLSELRIARYAPEHRDAVAELQTRLWSADRALNRRYLDWKYHANPFEPAGSPFEAAPCIFLAWQGEVLVGMRGFMPALWQAGPGGAAVLLRCAGDTVVRPGFEGRGLVGRLTSAGLEALRGQGELAVLNTSATEPVFRHSVRSGWQVLGAY